MEQKLILLNGFAGVGKSTIARMYISESPLTLCLEGDVVMGMIGEWRKNEIKARELKLALIISMLEKHLKSGHSVILPYLVTDIQHVKIFEDIAKKQGVDFVNTMLSVKKDEATRYLLERGRWGEEGSKLLTTEDVSHIHRLYDLMVLESTKLTDMRNIEVIRNDIESTYKNFLLSIR